MLFNLPQLSNTKWNTKLGFAASITFTGRLNAAFGNNSLGLDNMNNIFLSAKTERDISRKQAVIKDFKLFKLKYLPIPYQKTTTIFTFVFLSATNWDFKV